MTEYKWHVDKVNNHYGEYYSIGKMKAEGVPLEDIITRLMKAYSYTREDAIESIGNFELTEMLF